MIDGFVFRLEADSGTIDIPLTGRVKRLTKDDTKTATNHVDLDVALFSLAGCARLPVYATLADDDALSKLPDATVVAYGPNGEKRQFQHIGVKQTHHSHSWEPPKEMYQ